jgi:hypothetical protein
MDLMANLAVVCLLLLRVPFSTMGRPHSPTSSLYLLPLVLTIAWAGSVGAVGAPKPLDLKTVCAKATETVNGYSMKDVCNAMMNPLLAGPGGASYPPLASIFPSAAVTAASAVSPYTEDTSHQAERRLQQVGGLAAYYTVSYVPGIGCVLAAYDGVSLASVEWYILATTTHTVSSKNNMFVCTFTTASLVPVPVGAREDLAARNLLFPGSFAAIKPLVRCQFNLLTPVDRTLPVVAGDPSQGYSSSITL